MSRRRQRGFCAGTRDSQKRSRAGFSLLEVLVGVVLLATALLGLAGAASAGMMQTSRSRDDTQFWGDAQLIVDSLVARGYGISASTDSTTIRRRKVKWVVAAPGSPPQKVTLIVWRKGYQLTATNIASPAVPDTIIYYLTPSVPPV